MLPQLLAALPLHLRTLTLPADGAGGGWSVRAGPPLESWAAAAAFLPPAACGGDSPELWRMGRALLLPRSHAADGADDGADGADGVEAHAGGHAGAHALLRQARWWRLWLAAAPLQLLCAGASFALWGAVGALLTQVLAAFCPVLLAHGPLLTPDVLACALLHASLWAWWRLLHVSSPLSLGGAAVASGLLLCCGPVAWLLPPTAVLLGLIRLTSSEPTCLLLTGARQMLLLRRSSRLLWQLLLLPLLLLPAASLAAAAHAAAPAAPTAELSIENTTAPITATATATTAAAAPTLVPTTDAAWEREMVRALAALRRGPPARAGLAAATAATAATTATTAAAQGGWAPPPLVVALARQALSWRGLLRGDSCAASGGDDDAPRARKKRRRRAGDSSRDGDGGGGGGGGGRKGGPSDARVAWEGRDAWGEPPDPLHGGEAPFAYRSGSFARRGECLGGAHPEHTRWSKPLTYLTRCPVSIAPHGPAWLPLPAPLPMPPPTPLPLPLPLLLPLPLPLPPPITLPLPALLPVPLPTPSAPTYSGTASTFGLSFLKRHRPSSTSSSSYYSVPRTRLSPWSRRRRRAAPASPLSWVPPAAASQRGCLRRRRRRRASYWCSRHSRA